MDNTTQRPTGGIVVKCSEPYKQPETNKQYIKVSATPTHKIDTHTR